MTLWYAVSIVAVLATPAAASVSGTADAAATAPHDVAQPQLQRRQPDRVRPANGQCTGCATPRSARPPITEAPDRALMLIPASGSTPARPAWSDLLTESSGMRTTAALAMVARRPPLPRP